jgi:hypothetical protein
MMMMMCLLWCGVSLCRYEQNKHIFPASRWELFDPAKQRSEDQGYTIHGD